MNKDGPGLVIEGEAGSGMAEDAARAEAVRNQSESSTSAGQWRLVDKLMSARLEELTQRERILRDREQELLRRESCAAAGIREAEISAREAASKIVSDASIQAAKIIQAALDDTAQITSKSLVDAAALRQGAQDHLAASLAMAEVARVPAKQPPTGGQMFMSIGEKLIDRAASVFERLLIANPDVARGLSEGIASKVAPDSGTADRPAEDTTFENVATAAHSVSAEQLAEFLAKHGVEEIGALSLAQGKALVELANKLRKGSADASA